MSNKTFASIILIVGIAALLFFNPNQILNLRSNPAGAQSQSYPSRLKDIPTDNLLTLDEKLTELQTEVIMESESEDPTEVKTGDTIRVNYRGWLASNGQIFDQSFLRGDTGLVFTVGQGVIEGWSQGVVGMKLGEVRRLKIPSSLAYGESGQGESIPANADLIFDVELLEII